MKFLRVNKRRPCRVCGHDHWCQTREDGLMVVCMWTESTHPAPSGEGHLHFFDEQGNPTSKSSLPTGSPRPRKKTAVSQIKPNDCEQLARRWHRQIEPTLKIALAKKLGVTEEALDRMRVGWASRDELLEAGSKCGGLGTYTIPMRSPDMKVVGIHLRPISGKKYTTNESNMGLFIPSSLTTAGHPLYVPEGASDVMALLDAGLNALGRPSNVGGRQMVVAFVKKHRPKGGTIIVSDNDPPDKTTGRRPGRYGAQLLVNDLHDAGIHDVKIFQPPAGINDVRKYLTQHGGTRSLIENIVEKTKWSKKVLRSRQTPDTLGYRRQRQAGLA